MPTSPLPYCFTKGKVNLQPVDCISLPKNLQLLSLETGSYRIVFKFLSSYFVLLKHCALWFTLSLCGVGIQVRDFPNEFAYLTTKQTGDGWGKFSDKHVQSE